MDDASAHIAPIPSMTPYLQKNLPLIASRIEFLPVPPPPLPSITPRFEFFPQGVTGPGHETRAVSGDNIDCQIESEPILRAPGTVRPTLPASKIPKPPGEPGRPGSGGFCVESVLVQTHAWPKEAVDSLTVCPPKQELTLMLTE